MILALRRSGISVRTAKDSNKLAYERDGWYSKYELLNDAEWLYEKYWQDGLSTLEIASLVGAKASNSVRQALIAHNIGVRDASDGRTFNREDDGFIFNLDVINGCLLGDGMLEVAHVGSDISVPSFSKKNKFLDHIEFVGKSLFVDWAARLTYEKSKLTYKGIQNEYVYPKICSLTRKELLPLYKKWYPESNNYKKVVPRDIELNKVVLLHWFLDDGSTSYRRPESKTKQIRMTFCTESFSKEDQEFLCEQMKDKFGIVAKVRPYTEGTGWRMHVSQAMVKDFFDVIGQPPVPNLSYKWK